jgi:leader peptidase (prepilin peptidase)/N-methyltransferase
MDWHHPLYQVFIALFGACIGSFLNVCIYRIPAEVDLVKRRSYCGACGTPIPWKYNIPILGWVALRGRANCCGTRIDARYWMVEVLTAFLFWWLWKNHGATPLFWIYAFVTSGLMVASCIDLDYYIIPDRFTLGGCLAGFVVSMLYPQLHDQSTMWKGFVESLRGAFVGGLILFAIAKVGTWAFRREAMGLGDVKLLAAIGAFFGPWGAAFVLAASSVIGSVIGLAIIIQKRRALGLRMPYGPFISVAAVVWMMGGDLWMSRYIDHLRQLFDFFSRGNP